MQPQQQQISRVALADDHLLATMAVQLISSDSSLTPREAVEKCVEIIAESAMAVKNQLVIKAVQRRNPKFIEEEKAKQAARERGILTISGDLPPELLKRNKVGQG